MTTIADIEALFAQTGNSITRLEQAVTDVLFSRMPPGIELDSVEFDAGDHLVGNCRGLETLRDIRDLAAALGTEIEYEFTPADGPVLVVTVQVGPVAVSFDREVTEEEWSEISSELWGS